MNEQQRQTRILLSKIFEISAYVLLFIAIILIATNKYYICTTEIYDTNYPMLDQLENESNDYYDQTITFKNNKLRIKKCFKDKEYAENFLNDKKAEFNKLDYNSTEVFSPKASSFTSSSLPSK